MEGRESVHRQGQREAEKQLGLTTAWDLLPHHGNSSFSMKICSCQGSQIYTAMRDRRQKEEINFSR